MRAAHRGNWGQPIEKAIVERIPGIDADRFMELHRKIWPEFLRAGKLDAVDGNIETLKLIKESGKDLAILTARSLYTVEHLFDENHCIAKYVEKIYHLGNVRYQKPDPRVFGQILEDFKTGPQEAVYVGDSISDGICAKGAGLHFIATLESGLRSKEDFKAVPVDFFANRFPEIVNYINPSR